MQELNREPIKSQKIASIALKYEDDPLFSKRTYENIVKPKSFVVNQSSNELNTEPLDRTTNSSSAMNSKPRERVSYLNGLSLSEKYSKYLQKSSHSHSDTIHDCTIQRKPRISGTLLNETEDYLPKSKSESEKPSYKLKLPHQNYHNGTAVNELRKTQKEEKIIKEKSSHMKHSRNLEHLESSRLRVKPNLEKPSSHKSMVDKYSAQDYRTEKSRQKERNQTDGELEELKRAADEIIMAVNGYTDDSSIVGSSEEDRPRRIIRKDRVGNLGTISEGKRVTKTESRKSTSTNLNTRMAGNQSSASSIESLTKESIRPIRELKSSVRHRHGENSKSSSQRSSRLLQRATSREAIIGQPSSSEDIPSYLEQAKRRVVRRQKSGSSTKSEVTSDNKAASSSRHKSKTKTTKSSLTASTRNS